MEKNNYADGEMKFKNGLENRLPILCGEVGAKFFIFEDGTKTKTFYDCGAFIDDNSTSAGFYPIVNSQGQIVEYLSLLGKFYVKPTKVGNVYYKYLKDEPLYPYVKEKSGLGIRYTPYHSPITIPFAIFANKAFREAIKIEEERRAEQFMSKDMFFNQISYLTYKHETTKIIQTKLNQYNDNKKIIALKKKIATMEEGPEKEKLKGDLHLRELFFKANINNNNTTLF